MRIRTRRTAAQCISVRRWKAEVHRRGHRHPGCLLKPRVDVSSVVDSGRWRTTGWIAGCLAAALLVFAASRPERERSATRAREPGELKSANADAPVLALAADGIPIKPRGAHAAVSDQPMHPHPITAAHERIYRENNLVGALNLAVDLEDAPRIREVVAQYRAEYPEDAHRLQDGYAIIADCLDRPALETRSRAQQFWQTEIRSQTRRYVRRYCLER